MQMKPRSKFHTTPILRIKPTRLANQLPPFLAAQAGRQGGPDRFKIGLPADPHRQIPMVYQMVVFKDKR
ncbi:hypothetical protein T06_555 [Trichinella sp. T6]|nr:hypothetical protein T06_555 [Trichinella sp. T6]